MLRRLISVFTPLLGAALTLASVFLLLYMTVEAEMMEDPLYRSLAIGATLVAGVLLLMGSVYVCTRVAVLVFGRRDSDPNHAGPQALPR
jgi:hypothetical protein